MIRITGRHPSVTDVVQWFDSAHLPHDLQEITVPIEDLVLTLLRKLPRDTPELTVGLRKILEAKDALVRAAILGRPD